MAIGTGTRSNLEAGDAAYGNLAFLKHYCAWLSGPDPAARLPRFRGDVATARGFNGDIAVALKSWREALGSPDGASSREVDALARRIRRKTLFAVAGLVSVHDSTWTTDRGTAAARWAVIQPEVAQDLALLLAWGDETTPAHHSEVARILHTTVPAVVKQFHSPVGAWPSQT